MSNMPCICAIFCLDNFIRVAHWCAARETFSPVIFMVIYDHPCSLHVMRLTRQYTLLLLCPLLILPRCFLYEAITQHVFGVQSKYTTTYSVSNYKIMEFTKNKHNFKVLWTWPVTYIFINLLVVQQTRIC